MPISGEGWELLVERQGIQRFGDGARTCGTYRVFLDGVATDLQGMMCESLGPGDNQVAGNGKRLEAGRYPLATQFGRRYVTGGYAIDDIPGSEPMPGLLLTKTGKRTAIVLHPAHPPNLYLTSVGCLNPTRTLAAHEAIDFFDSRARVLALIDSLRAFAPNAFAEPRSTPILGAAVIIEGEP